MSKLSKNNSSVSFIIEQHIPPEKTEAFLRWQETIIKASREFPGYLRTDNFPPSHGIRDKWYTVIHFDTPENLTIWLDSDTRHQLIRNRREQLGFYRLIAYKNSFEDWLIRQNNLPQWKQALTVLFGLYPTVMTATLIFSRWQITESWPVAIVILVSNIISCSMLTWIVMPLVRKLFNFWLKPPQPSSKIDWLGIFLITIGISFMVSLFLNIS